MKKLDCDKNGAINRECIALQFEAGSSLFNTIMQAKSISKINENALVQFKFGDATYIVDWDTDTDGMYAKCMNENLSFNDNTYDFSESNRSRSEERIHVDNVQITQSNASEKKSYIQSIRLKSRKLPKLK